MQTVDFLDSAEDVFEASIEVLRHIGKITKLNREDFVAIARVRKGVNLAWQPIFLLIEVVKKGDRTTLTVSSEQEQSDNQPDSRGAALDLFRVRLLRRKELTPLD
jgi:hypothetical protein